MIELELKQEGQREDQTPFTVWVRTRPGLGIAIDVKSDDRMVSFGGAIAQTIEYLVLALNRAISTEYRP